MRHLTYLAVLLVCAVLTLPLEFAFRCQVLTRLRSVALAVTPGFVLFVLWDLYAIRRGQWSFDPAQLSGITLPGRLPLEEALFFLVVPVAAILTFESVRRCRRHLRPGHTTTVGRR